MYFLKDLTPKEIQYMTKVEELMLSRNKGSPTAARDSTLGKWVAEGRH
jgi:hypothetical protein